jgi:predicted adenylyl cyclase CyaB
LNHLARGGMVFLFLKMPNLNVEIKAKCADPAPICKYLGLHGVLKGSDHQTDTYFKVAHGRLKLREGVIENNLIHYHRPDVAGIRDSRFTLFAVTDAVTLKQILTDSNGIKVVVEKIREIYFIDNVKFHLDTVSGLGNFMEIEASDLFRPAARDELFAQCRFYMNEFGIADSDLIAGSYSDMLDV